MTRGRLALVLLLVTTCGWLAGNLVMGGMVAPAVFSLAPPRGDVLNRALAGQIVGLALERWSFLALLLWTAVLACVLRLTVVLLAQRRRGLVLVLVAGALALLALRPLGHVAVVEGGQLAAELRRDAPPDTDPRRAQFRALHGRSMALGLVETLVVAALAVLAATALCRADAIPGRR